MKNLEWNTFYYNGNETNIEATKCGRVRKVKKSWYGQIKGKNHQIIYGEIDLTNRVSKSNGYIQIMVSIKNLKSRPFTIHQIISCIYLNHKIIGRNLVIDHIDSNKLNNNINNLRIITQRENCSKEKTIASGLPAGVNFYKSLNKYVSKIHYNKKKHHLGYFETIDEAKDAYLNCLKTLSI